jgi:signal peptidase I
MRGWSGSVMRSRTPGVGRAYGLAVELVDASAVRPSVTDQDAAMKTNAREIARTAGALMLLLVARSSFADHYVVPSGSMEGTLMPGDRVLVDKRAYGLRVPFTLTKLVDGDRPARGDIVVFDSREDGTRLIKRVVAVGGDVLEVRRGHVFIDGRALGAGEHESFGARTAELELDHGGGPDLAPVVVPPGQVFVLGDHRGNSRDSRFFGFVPTSDIYARASRVYYRSNDGFVWKSL